MNSSLISIIIPVYNAEKYVAECAESLINQTYKNIEIIFVDDCSKDVSCEILKQYTEKDSRVKLYSTGTNGGPGKARNIGLENANGEYIMFCDNDDTYEPNMCELMLKTMTEKNVDMVTCKSNVINGKLDRAQEHYVNSNNVGYFNFSEKKRFIVNVFVWNKLYKKSLIDKYNLKFTTLFSEDDLFTFIYNSVIDSYYGLEDKLYNLVLHKTSYTQSIAKGKNPKMKWDKLYILKEYIEFLEKNNLLYRMLECLKINIRNELGYIFRYFNFSVIEYIVFMIKYRKYTRNIKDKDIGFYKIYLKYRTPWWFLRLLTKCYW